MNACFAQHVIELLAGFFDLHIKPFCLSKGCLLTAQSFILQLIFCLSGKEIKATATVGDPAISELDAAISKPDGVTGSNAVDHLSQQTVTAGEDGDADDLIFLNGTVCNKCIHGFVEDGAGYRFDGTSLEFTYPDRAEDGWVLCWSWGIGWCGRFSGR
jgi:hypothetical protein